MCVVTSDAGTVAGLAECGCAGRVAAAVLHVAIAVDQSGISRARAGHANRRRGSCGSGRRSGRALRSRRGRHARHARLHGPRATGRAAAAENEAVCAGFKEVCQR